MPRAGRPSASFAVSTPGDLDAQSRGARAAILADAAAGPQRTVGYPFSLVVQPETGRLAWCRALPVPAEGATGHSGVRVPQPAACTGAATPAAR